MKKVFVCIALILWSSPSYSQNLTFNELGEKEGLIAEHMSYLMKDSRGYIWICSNYGLIRYDGKDFKNFRNSFTDTTTISNDNVLFVLEDKEGFLWVSTNQGLNRFDPKKQIFLRFEHNPYNPTSIGSNEVVRTLQDLKGRLWIGTTNGLSLYLGNGKFKNWSDFKSSEKPFRYTTHQILEDPSDATLLWLVGASGFFSFKTDTETFTEYVPPLGETDKEDDDKNQRKSFTRLFIDKDESIWLGNNYGEIFRYEKKTNKWTIKSFGEKKGLYYTINCIAPDDEDHLWICTGSSINSTTLHKLNKKDFTLEPFPSNSVHHNFTLSKPGINSVYKDNEGITWFTSSRAICKLDPYLQYFSYYALGQVKDVDPPRVSNMIEADNTVLMGMDYELFIIDRLTNKYSIQKFPALNNLGKKTTISTLFYEPAKKITWIATSAGVFILDNVTEKMIQAPAEFNFSKRGSSITEIMRDSKGNLWFAFYLDGLLRYNPQKKEWTEFTNEIASIKNSPQQLKIYDLLEDAHGTIWVATHAGLRLLDNTSGKLITLSTYIEGSSKLQSLKTLNLTHDQNKNIWIGTLGNGLIGIKTGKPKAALAWAYGTKEGLCDNNISNVAIDKKGTIWATSHKGLIHIDPSTSKIQNYYKSDGLVTDHLNGHPILVAEKGDVYVGTLSGYQFFRPTGYKKKERIPPIQLRKVNSPAFFSGDTLTQQKLILDYTKNELSFSFNALNFSKPEANRYKYRLIGFQNYWVNATAENNSASYTNLNPGDYTFTVKAANHDGVWNEKGASIKITILPPPWKTWWAYLIYAITLILLSALALNEVVKRERLKAKAKLKELEAEKYHELDTLKSNFFANISHEFRTPLTIILGGLEQKIQTAEGVENKIQLSLMQRNAQRLLRLVNQLLDLSRIESESLKLKTSKGNIIAFCTQVASSFHSLAEANQIQYSMNSGSTDFEMYFDHDKVDKILNNLLGNAFKFTKAEGKVSVEIQQREPSSKFKEGSVEITIQDTGIGIPTEHLTKIFDRFYQVDNSNTRSFEGSGIGLALTKELVELHKGHITVTSEADKGTTFIVHLPLGKNHLSPDEILEIDQAYLIPVVENNLFNNTTQSELLNDESGKTNETILIVEDNADLRYYLKESFRKRYTILEAEDGTKALDISLKNIPDLIISDLMMPLMDGMELCSKIKSNELTSHIPLILLTAKADVSTRLEGLETGADDYIAKPFNLNELHVRIKNVLLNRKKIHDHYAKQLIIKPRPVEVQSLDEKFLTKAMNIIEKEIGNPLFGVESFASEMGVSSIQLYRKLKALTNRTPNELIRNLRLERAASLLQQKAGNVAEVAYQVGFNNLSYFAKVFKEKFGVVPSEYL